MRILYLTHRVPYAPDRGDRIRAYHTIRFLEAAGHQVHVFALAHDDEEERRSADLDRMCNSWTVVRVSRLRNLVRAIPALPTSQPLTHVLLDAPGAQALLRRIRDSFKPEMLFAFCSGVAQWAIGPPFDGLPLVLDLVDVDSAKWAAYATDAAVPWRWVYAREARTLGAFEEHAMRAAVTTLVINDREAAHARTLAPDARIVRIGNGVDVDFFAAPPDLRREPDVVFTAVFDYRPNVEGAVWFATKVWPLVRACRPDARLLLVGARPTAAVRALASVTRGVIVTGAVPDVRTYLWGARVAIAPLFIARGTQNKVMEALAAGLPSVVTRTVLEGLPASVQAACTAADAPDDFASAVCGLLDEGIDQRGATAEPSLLGRQTWHCTLAPLNDIIAKAIPTAGPATTTR